MTTKTKGLNAAVKEQAKEIVTGGADIRPRLAEVVSRAGCQFRQSEEGLISLVRAAVDGAREGLSKSVPADRDDVLRQVMDALGDGLSQTALAGQLALQEAVSASRQYTNDDLLRLRDDLTAVRDMFTDTVGQGLRTTKELTASQATNAMTHAERVAKALGPVFTELFDAIEQHPVILAREGFEAGINAGKTATGSLFQALGRMLQQAGEELRRERKADE